MYADPAHTRATTQAELDVVARKHGALRDELSRSGEPSEKNLAFPSALSP